ncbi:MAG TPA: hypothetical protein VG917_00385 [Patescibacteria group bacterium]|nr:hypothetical protein [Patescibacteria group bacterium]
MTESIGRTPEDRLVKKGFRKIENDYVAGWLLPSGNEPVTEQAYEDLVLNMKAQVLGDPLGFLASADAPEPKRNAPLMDRLGWTMQKSSKDREEIATGERIRSSDIIRGELLDKYDEHGLSIYTQMRLIHRAHMKGREHVILTRGQARRLVRDAKHVDRLAGKVRSADDLNLDIGLAGGLVECVSKEKTPELLQKLAAKAEELFPKGSINQKVNEENIYLYLSAFQTIYALIHPFYEANGRTSEDLMLVLWKRRPDLAHTIRYVSGNGEREDEDVYKRMEIIDASAVTTMNRVGEKMGLSFEQVAKVKRYSDLIVEVEANGMDEEESEGTYHTFFDEEIDGYIKALDDEDELKKIPGIKDLADHLKTCSPLYLMEAGVSLFETLRNYEAKEVI